MEEKLIELLRSFRTPICDGLNAKLPDIEGLADYLLKNGVIVLPFPIGTKYYRIVCKRGKIGCSYFNMIREAVLNWYNIDRVLKDFEKTVFLSRQEAEEGLVKLVKGEENGIKRYN